MQASGIPYSIHWPDDINEPGYSKFLVLADWDSPLAEGIAVVLEQDFGVNIGDPIEWIECGTCNGIVRTTPTHSRWRYSYDYPCDGEVACSHCLDRHSHLRAGVIELAFDRSHKIGHLIDPEREGMACLYSTHSSYAPTSPEKIGNALEAAGLDRWAYTEDSDGFQVWAYPNDLDGIHVSRTLSIPGLSEGIAKAMMQLASV
jgi:hypothetical protein